MLNVGSSANQPQPLTYALPRLRASYAGEWPFNGAALGPPGGGGGSPVKLPNIGGPPVQRRKSASDLPPVENMFPHVQSK